MLYNPQWNNKTNSDPDTKESLIAWLEKQPANMGYTYIDSRACLMAQYYRHHNLTYMPPNPFTFWNWDKFRWQTEWHVACGYPRTFGAALDRARKALS